MAAVLIIEDERFLLEMAQDILTSLGYEAFGARDSFEALKVINQFIEQKKKIDAVIIDLFLPVGSNGVQLLSQIKSTYPHVHSIAVSAYADHPVMLRPSQYGFNKSINKPYCEQDIASCLSAML